MRILHAGIVAALLALTACGGGSNGTNGTSTTTTPDLVSLQVTAANPSVAVGNTQQFKATGTFSDNSTQDLTSTATWSSSSTTIATISGSGLATAVAAGTIAIKAASGSVSGSMSFVVTSSAATTVQISSLSETSASPFDLLTIAGSGFSNGTRAISVMFVPESGDPVVMLPVSVSDPSNIQVMVPPFFNSAGNLAAETVDIQVVAYSSTTTYASNSITGLQVNTVPGVSAPTGAVTAALLSASANMALSLQDVATLNSSFANLSTPLAQFSTDLSPIASAVNSFVTDPAQTSTTIPTANGQTVTLTVQELAQADQLAQALVAAIVKQGQIPAATSTGNCPVPTGDATFDSNLCSMQQYFQALGAQAATSALRQRAAKGMAELRPKLLTKPQAALVAVVFNVAVSVIAEACEPAGGYLVYELVVAPVVTSTFSLLATEDLPLDATQEVGAYDIAFGLTVLDNVFFDGIPVLSASKDSVDVGVALYKDITFESPTPYGMVNYEGPINASSLDYYGSTGPLVSENIQPPTPHMPPDSLTLVLPPASTPYTLSVTTSGNGTVTWFPSGALFQAGTVVQPVAVPAAGSTFAGWGGACSGMGACSVTMDADRTVTATLTAASNDTGNPSTIDLGSVGGCNGGTISGVINITAAPGVTWTWPPNTGAGDPTLSATPTSGSGSGVVTVTDTQPAQPAPLGSSCSNTQPIAETSYITIGFSDGGSAQITVNYTFIYVAN